MKKGLYNFLKWMLVNPKKATLAIVAAATFGISNFYKKDDSANDDKKDVKDIEIILDDDVALDSADMAEQVINDTWNNIVVPSIPYLDNIQNLRIVDIYNKRAQDKAKQALALDSDNLKARIIMAWFALKSKDYNKALSLIGEDFYSKDPDVMSSALLISARAFYSIGFPYMAFTKYVDAADIVPVNEKSKLQLQQMADALPQELKDAQNFVDAKNDRAARDILEDFFEDKNIKYFNPAHLEYGFVMAAKIYEKSKEFDQASVAWENAFDASNENLDYILFAASNAYESKSDDGFRRTNQLIRKIVFDSKYSKKFDKMDQAWRIAARAREAMGDYNRARVNYQKAGDTADMDRMIALIKGKDKKKEIVKKDKSAPEKTKDKKDNSEKEYVNPDYKSGYIYPNVKLKDFLEQAKLIEGPTVAITIFFEEFSEIAFWDNKGYTSLIGKQSSSFKAGKAPKGINPDGKITQKEAQIGYDSVVAHYKKYIYPEIHTYLKRPIPVKQFIALGDLIYRQGSLGKNSGMWKVLNNPKSTQTDFLNQMSLYRGARYDGKIKAHKGLIKRNSVLSAFVAGGISLDDILKMEAGAFYGVNKWFYAEQSFKDLNRRDKKGNFAPLTYKFDKATANAWKKYKSGIAVKKKGHIVVAPVLSLLPKNKQHLLKDGWDKPDEETQKYLAGVVNKSATNKVSLKEMTKQKLSQVKNQVGDKFSDAAKKLKKKVSDAKNQNAKNVKKKSAKTTAKKRAAQAKGRAR